MNHNKRYSYSYRTFKTGPRAFSMNKKTRRGDIHVKFKVILPPSVCVIVSFPSQLSKKIGKRAKYTPKVERSSRDIGSRQAKLKAGIEKMGTRGGCAWCGVCVRAIPY